MKLYRTPSGPVLESDNSFFRLHERWDTLINHPNLFEHLRASAACGKGAPLGCVLLTETGVVPPDDFTLQSRDEVRIEITGIGALVNCVE